MNNEDIIFIFVVLIVWSSTSKMFKYTVYLSTWPCLMQFVVCTKPPLWNWKSLNGCSLSRKIVLQVQDFVTKCCKNRTQPISDETVSFSGWSDPTPPRSNAFPVACSTSLVLSCLVFSSFSLCLLLCFVSFFSCLSVSLCRARVACYLCWKCSQGKVCPMVPMVHGLINAWEFRWNF